MPTVDIVDGDAGQAHRRLAPGGHEYNVWQDALDAGWLQLETRPGDGEDKFTWYPGDLTLIPNPDKRPAFAVGYLDRVELLEQVRHYASGAVATVVEVHRGPELTIEFADASGQTAMLARAPVSALRRLHFSGGPAGPPPPRIQSLQTKIDSACARIERWIRELPRWPADPVSASGSSAGPGGPTLLSEADCQLQFARQLNATGVAWEDLHIELQRTAWMYKPDRPGAHEKWRADLAVVDRDSLAASPVPDGAGKLVFDAFIEFAFASSHWKYGPLWGDPDKKRAKVAADIEKVSRYVKYGLCHLGYVVVVEECDYGFEESFVGRAEQAHPGVLVRIVRGWR